MSANINADGTVRRLTARDEVLERFRGDGPDQVRHFGNPERIVAALELAREGKIRCRWAPVHTHPDNADLVGGGPQMLACQLVVPRCLPGRAGDVF
jgi:hypothetical protein